PGPETLLDAAQRSIAARAGEYAAAAAGDLTDLEQVHRLRITVKRLRYDLELAAKCLHAPTFAEAFPRVERLQDQLGRLNDRREAAERLAQILAEFAPPQDQGEAEPRRQRRPSEPVRRGLERIAEQCRRRRDRAHERFLQFWRQTGSRTLAADL